jgi:1-aminocyclopropane-1-carboxylate deaminase
MNQIGKIAHPPLQKITHEVFEEKKLSVHLLRLDKIHPTVNGNKWYKLKHNIHYAIQNNYEGILTFGGQFSNHIYATAAAANLSSLKSVGIIGGANALALTSTLHFAMHQGMQLHFISKEEYRKKGECYFLENIKNNFPNYLIVPEGGTNQLAIAGTSEIASLIPIDFNFIVTACGTGGTIAGIAKALLPHQKAVGISVLKGKDLLTEKIQQLIGGNSNFEILTQYHFGGYAKTTEALRKFMVAFHVATNIPIEQVYTAKMLFGTIDLARHNYFPAHSTVILLHTGGLQGLDHNILRIACD